MFSNEGLLSTHHKRSVARDLEDKDVSVHSVVASDLDYRHGEADEKRSLIQVCGYSVCNEV